MSSSERATVTTPLFLSPRKKYAIDDAKAVSSESPVRLGTKPRMPSKNLHPGNRNRQDTPISAGTSHSLGEANQPPRKVMGFDNIFRLQMLQKHNQVAGTPQQVVDSPQTPPRKKRGEGWMAVVCATPRLSMNRAMVGIREFYASPEKPSSPRGPTQEMCSVDERSLEEEEGEEFDIPQSPSFRATPTTPTRAVGGRSLFTPARPGRKA